MSGAQFLLMLLLATRSITITAINHEGDFAFDSYNDPLVSIYQNAEYDNDCLIQRLWGVPDMPAYIGYVFHLRIPKDAFSGKVVGYKITGEDGPLPSWLWVGDHGVIRGIPSPEDQGEHRVLVTALTENQKSQHCSPAIEVFTIYVKDKKESQTIPQGENQCHLDEDETKLIIIIDKPFQQITPKRRLNSIINIANFMDLDYNTFFIQPYEVYVDNNIDHVDGLMSSVSGARQEHFKESSEIVITVGCSGVLWTKYSILVHKIEQMVIDGTISEVVHLPVKGWKLVRYKKPSLSRRRRMMRPEGSTFDDDDDDSKKYDKVVEKMYKHPADQGKNIMAVSKGVIFEGIKMGSVEEQHTGTMKIPAVNNFTTESTKTYKTETSNNEDSKERQVELNNDGFMIISVDNSAEGNKSTDTLTVGLHNNESSHEIIDVTTEILINFPTNPTPEKQHRTLQMITISGKYFSYIIPEISFENEMNASNLHLAMYDIGHVPLQSSSWLQFNPKTKEAYGLPLEDHVSKWKYIIEATDNQGVSVINTLNIIVQQHKESQDVNHEFSMKLHVEKEYPAIVDWQIRALKGLVELFRDTDMNQITVRGVNIQSDLVEFLWTNDTLPKHFCARYDILQLMNVILKSDTDGRPSIELITAMSPELRVISVSWRAIGPCIISYTLVVIPIIFITVLILVGVFIACVLYKRGRMGTMSLGITKNKHGFHSKDIPVFFENGTIEGYDQSDKFSVIMKEEKPPLLPTQDYKTVDRISSARITPHHSSFKPSNKTPCRNSSLPPPYI